uniref:Zinc finger CCCH domain-containing protein 16 n=1 Tax=Anthurium amnicola TaxID=1678845 RepID=A0A1D1YJD6_9ARAE
MNGRYYAGKQTCSHGTACNFIHCFHNPGGDYEWADWDNPPPRYWVKKMDVLFGPCNELRHDINEELENQQLPRKSNKKRMQKSDGNYCRGARYSETGLSSSSGGDDSDGGRDRYSSRPKRSYSRHRRKSIDFTDKWERSPRDHVPEVDCSDYSIYDVGDDMLKAKDSSSSHKEKKFRDRSCVEYHDIHARKHGKSDSRSRSREKIAADGEGKLEKKSKYHGQQKRRHELINSDGSYNKTKDGSQRDGLSSNRANYKLVSDDGEENNDSPRSADLYSEKGPSYKRHVDSVRFDRCNEFKKSHERSSSKYQSRHRWCYNESKFRKQEANGEDLSPIESLDDWKIVDAKFGEVHNKSVRSRSHCRSDLADSKSLEGSNASMYEHKHERSITRRKRHRKKGEHQDMEEENGDAAL